MLARLVLTDVRNHAAATLSPGSGFVVLTGDNGTGKTNVLEAVSLLAQGRGLRRARLPDVARQSGSGGFGIAATLGDGVTLATGIAAEAPQRRIVRVNGAAAPAAALAERLTVLWITPAMDRLFTAAAADRRRFLDRLVLALTPSHGVHAARYEAAMRARARLLAGWRADGRLDRSWVGALEAQMAEHGAAIAAARAATVVALGEAIATAPDAPFPRAGLAIADDGSGGGDLAGELARARERDAAAGRALIGPHRSDLIVTYAAKAQPAAQASTGEQKALLIGLVLAHATLVAARTGRGPVLLLDEVAAHLDPHRRAALFTRLAGSGQVWMTGTEPGLFDALGNATRYALDASGIAPA